MPVMPRPKKAKAIAAKIMKHSGGESSMKKEPKAAGGRETKFDRDVRTMIKR